MAAPLIFNPSTSTMVEDPDRSHWQTIGDTTVPLLNPREVRTAAIAWNTTGFGPASGTSRDWHIHVIVDPDNVIPNETYESEAVDPDNWPGQNNEGWAKVTVSSPPPAAPHGVQRLVKLDKRAMGAIAANGKLQTQTAQAEAGQPLRIQVRASTNLPGTGYRRVQLFDGDPNAGGQLIGEEEIFVGDMAGQTAEFRWTPLSEGQHHLYAKLLTISDDDPSGNTIDELKIVVHKAKDKVKDNFTSK
jgi:hypothetical protein